MCVKMTCNRDKIEKQFTISNVCGICSYQKSNPNGSVGCRMARINTKYAYANTQHVLCC